MKITIEIENITKNHAVVLKQLVKDMELLGKMGGSRFLAFYSDGDGNFRPKVTVTPSEELPDIKYYPMKKKERSVPAFIYDDEHIT